VPPGASTRQAPAPTTGPGAGRVRTGAGRHRRRWSTGRRRRVHHRWSRRPRWWSSRRGRPWRWRSGGTARSPRRRLRRRCASPPRGVVGPLPQPAGDDHPAALGEGFGDVSAGCRHRVQRRNNASPSFHSPLARSKIRGVEATVKSATATPDAVKRGSGSAVRFPTQSDSGISGHAVLLRVGDRVSLGDDVVGGDLPALAVSRPANPRRFIGGRGGRERSGGDLGGRRGGPDGCRPVQRQPGRGRGGRDVISAVDSPAPLATAGGGCRAAAALSLWRPSGEPVSRSIASLAVV
jgi:hypothetical protein